MTEKIVSIHGGPVSRAVSESMIDALDGLKQKAEGAEIQAFVVTAILENGARLNRWHVPSGMVYATVGALHMTLTELATHGEDE